MPLCSFLHFTFTKTLKRAFGFLPVMTCGCRALTQVLQRTGSLRVRRDITLLYQGRRLPSCKLRYDQQPRRVKLIALNMPRKHSAPRTCGMLLCKSELMKPISFLMKSNFCHNFSEPAQALSLHSVFPKIFYD